MYIYTYIYKYIYVYIYTYIKYLQQKRYVKKASLKQASFGYHIV